MKATQRSGLLGFSENQFSLKGETKAHSYKLKWISVLGSGFLEEIGDDELGSARFINADLHAEQKFDLFLRFIKVLTLQVFRSDRLIQNI